MTATSPHPCTASTRSDAPPAPARPIAQPIRLGRRTAHSRLVLPPMASATGDDRGRVTDETLAHYARIVAPQHGVAFVEYTYVHPMGRSEPRQLGLIDDEHEAGMAQLASLIRSRGALAGLQLTHAGGKTSPDLLDGAHPLGASAVPIPAHGGDLPAPAAMTNAQVDEVLDAFASSTQRAARAGFDVVEVHAAHGYWFNQWLSPITNQRAGAARGTSAERFQLLVELMRRLRTELADSIILSVRFAAQDRLAGGLSLADGVLLARELHAAGVDVLNVSSGLGGWRRGRDSRGEGYLVSDAAAIRAGSGLPVIGVGGVETIEFADAAIARGDVDMIAVGRAVLRDPTWVAGVLRGG